MEGLELLEKHPLSAKLIREWFMEKMIESLNDNSITDEFRQFMREQVIDDDKIGIMIDANPRMLFDVLDDNNIRIHICVGSDVSSDNFSFHIASDVIKTDASQGESVKGLINDFKTRKETEIKAINYAFELLEIKLSPKIEEIN